MRICWNFAACFRDLIKPKVISDESMAFNNCSLFEINSCFGWQKGRDIIGMWFKLVLIKRSIEFLIGCSNLFSLLFKYVYQSEPEDEISICNLSAMLEIIFLLSEVYNSWKCWNSFLFSFFSCAWQILRFFVQKSIEFLAILSVFLLVPLFFCLCLLTIAHKPLKLSVE